jgi:hypothetical protein
LISGQPNDNHNRDAHIDHDSLNRRAKVHVVDRAADRSLLRVFFIDDSFDGLIHITDSVFRFRQSVLELLFHDFTLQTADDSSFTALTSIPAPLIKRFEAMKTDTLQRTFPGRNVVWNDYPPSAQRRVNIAERSFPFEQLSQQCFSANWKHFTPFQINRGSVTPLLPPQPFNHPATHLSDHFRHRKHMVSVRPFAIHSHPPLRHGVTEFLRPQVRIEQFDHHRFAFNAGNNSDSRLSFL